MVANLYIYAQVNMNLIIYKHNIPQIFEMTRLAGHKWKMIKHNVV